MEAARADLRALQAAGFDAVMFGNENDRPYEFDVDRASTAPMNRVFLAVLCLVLATAASADTTALASVNALRAEAGGPSLARSHRLDAIAAAHASDMARRGVMTHTGADGSGPGARARARGYRYCRIAENVAQGFPSVGAVLRAWQGSPKHRRNMLDPRVTEMGLARASGDYWVMVLAQPGC